MAERPKPPEGYETWLDWCVAPPIDGLGEKPREYAREELEELRNDLVLFKAFATCNCSDCMAKRRGTSDD
jgi:hypothetical protein